MTKRKPKKTPRAGAEPAPASGDYAARALDRLVWLMDHAESEQAQVTAAKELLARMRGAAGKPDRRAAVAALDEVVARLRELRGAKQGGKPGGAG